jgi:hypothetical protein
MIYGAGHDAFAFSNGAWACHNEISSTRRKETHCDFCSKLLPDWKPVLTPAVGVAAPAVMNVNFGGKTYSFEVEHGDEGYKLFTGAIRKAFSLPGDSELNITFTCDDPISGGPSL